MNRKLAPLIVALLAAAAAAPAAGPAAYDGLTWDRRWAIADSLLERGRQTENAGQLDSALAYAAEALAAHPSHYRSWWERWSWLARKSAAERVAPDVVAGWIEADLARVEAGDDTPDRTFVIGLALDRLYGLTGDGKYEERRRQALRQDLAAHPRGDRAFQFRLLLGAAAATDDEARAWYAEALATAPFPAAVHEVAEGLADRGLAQPGFLSAAGVDSVWAWWGRGATAFGNPIDQERALAERSLWRARWEFDVRRDAAAAEAQLDEGMRHRRALNLYEDELRRRNPKAPVGPFAVLDANADLLRGDIAQRAGDGFRAKAHYRTAWGRVEPIEAAWRAPSRLPWEMRVLRDRLAPMFAAPAGE